MDGENNRRTPPNGEAKQDGPVELEKRYGTIGCAAIKAAAMVGGKLEPKRTNESPPKSVRDDD